MKITYEHVTYRYHSTAPPALNDVHLEFDTTHLTGICGMTGSGKSTFIQHVNGLLKPSSGCVRIDQEDIHQSLAALRRVRQCIGMTFQFPERQLFGRTVWEELSYTLEKQHVPAQDITRRIESVAALLRVDLHQHRNHSPFALSQSDQRKLGIAVILTLQPELLVLDEPTAGMDRARASQFLDVLRSLHDHHNRHCLIVSHDLELLLKFTQQIIVLAEGKIVFVGTPDAIVNAAAHLETAGILLPPVHRTLRLLRETYPQLSPGGISVSDVIAEVILPLDLLLKKNIDRSP